MHDVTNLSIFATLADSFPAVLRTVVEATPQLFRSERTLAWRKGLPPETLETVAEVLRLELSDVHTVSFEPRLTEAAARTRLSFFQTDSGAVRLEGSVPIYAMLLQLDDAKIGPGVARVSDFLVRLCLTMAFQTYSVGREFGVSSQNELNPVFPYAVLGGDAGGLTPFLRQFENLGASVFSDGDTVVVELVTGQEMAGGAENDAQLMSLIGQCVASSWKTERPREP